MEILQKIIQKKFLIPEDAETVFFKIRYCEKDPFECDPEIVLSASDERELKLYWNAYCKEKDADPKSVLDVELVNYIVYRKGDLVKSTDIDIFVHQCNCFATMGAGIARQIAKTYPEVAEADKDYYKSSGSQNIFGTILPVKTSDGRICINQYSQYHYGKGKQTDYDKFKECLEQISDYLIGLDMPDLKVGFPAFIGCGLAGGDWDIISLMIHDFAKSIKNPVYIVDFN